MAVSLTGADTTIFDGIVLNDFGSGNIVNITFPNNIIQMTKGKNQNTLYAKNNTGEIADVEIILLLGSNDYKTLNSRFLQQQRDLPTFSLISASFTKRSGDGEGNVTNSIYTGTGGIFTQGIDIIDNTEGDTIQAQALFRLQFANMVLTVA